MFTEEERERLLAVQAKALERAEEVLDACVDRYFENQEVDGFQVEPVPPEREREWGDVV
ncbi:hypothetical protein ACFL51_01765 [Myxococcota bacterium]